MELLRELSRLQDDVRHRFGRHGELLHLRPGVRRRDDADRRRLVARIHDRFTTELRDLLADPRVNKDGKSRLQVLKEQLKKSINQLTATESDELLRAGLILVAIALATETI